MTTTEQELAPYLAVAVVVNCALLLCAPLESTLVSLATGELLARWTFDDVESAARQVASVSLSAETSSSSSLENFDTLVAFVGDDKQLNVYRVTGSASSSNSLKTVKIWSQALPKRAVKLLWEAESDSEKRLIVGDRHGDVRSYVIPIVEHEVEATTTVSTQPTENAAAPQADTSAVEKMEDEEEAGTLHVGHVSFLTDFALSSFTTSPTAVAPHPASFIITSDRDEHIRISRWGRRRAGYIALRYLLGSREAVSSFCVVEGAAAQALRSSKALTPHGKSVCAYPILVSSDASTLRIWSLHPDSEADTRQDCQAAFDLAGALESCVVVDAWRERRRGRLFGKGKPKTAQQQQQQNKEAATMDNGPVHEPDFTPVITKLQTFVVEGQVYLVFKVDGAKALFTVSAAALASCTTVEQAVEQVNAVDVEMPVLDYTLHQSDDGRVDAWLVTDIRREFVANASRTKPLTLLRWNQTTKCFTLVPDDDDVVLQRQSIAQAPNEVSSGLILYDALTLFNKQEFEVVEGYQTHSPEGLVRGGLANFEIMGKPRGNPNHGNSERTTRKREKAREVMKKRIEARLAQ